MEFLYKPNMAEVVHRHEQLWTRNFTDGILVKVDIDGLSTIDFHISGMMHLAPDYKQIFNAYQDFYASRRDVLDDSIPVARASLGSAAIGHFFGGEVQWTPGGAYSPALINELKTFDFSQLDYNPKIRWVKTQMDMVDYFVQKADGLFPVCITEVLIGLQFAEYLLGPEMYLALYDHPALLTKLVDKSIEFNIRLIDEQRKSIRKYHDGVFEMFEVWLPGNQIWNSVEFWVRESGIMGPSPLHEPFELLVPVLRVEETDVEEPRSHVDEELIRLAVVHRHAVPPPY